MRVLRQMRVFGALCVTAMTLAGTCAGVAAEVLSPSVTASRGAINGVCIERGGRRLVIYGDPLADWKTADMVLFTHSRRVLSRQ
jgi:hypothetical protein